MSSFGTGVFRLVNFPYVQRLGLVSTLRSTLLKPNVIPYSLHIANGDICLAGFGKKTGYIISAVFLIWIADWDSCVSAPYACRNHTANLPLPFSRSHVFSRLLSLQFYVCKGGSTSVAPRCATLLFACLNTGLCGSSGNKWAGFVTLFSPLGYQCYLLLKNHLPSACSLIRKMPAAVPEPYPTHPANSSKPILLF